MFRFRYQDKNQLLIILLAVGFFIGVIYENIISKNMVIITEIFSKGNLQRYLQTDIIAEKYFWYVIKYRVLLLFLLCSLSCIKWKKILVVCCLLLTGFFTGSFCVASVLQLGAKGLLLCLLGLFPQMLFYGCVYGILFIHWFHYPERHWNRTKTLFSIVLFVIGILSEVYVNPILIKIIIRIF